MRKVIATMNVTIDGFCDHTSGVPDEDLHQHYADLIKGAGGIIYGRVAYQLMESHWPNVVKNPTGDKATDDFAVAIENVPKILFSNTLTSVGWKNVTLVKEPLKEYVTKLKQQPGKDIFVGSPSLILAITKLGLIDEYQLCVHPVIAGSGMPLFKDLSEHIILSLLNIKKFNSGILVLYYQPIKK